MRNRHLKTALMQDLHTSDQNLTKGKRAKRGFFIAAVSFCISFNKHSAFTERNTDKEEVQRSSLCFSAPLAKVQSVHCDNGDHEPAPGPP